MTEGGQTLENPSPGAFERAFDAGKREYEVFDGKIEARILTPDPERLTDPVPVVLAPGWGETQEVFKKSAEVIFNSGRTVIILDHPRKGAGLDEGDLAQIANDQELPLDELRKAVTLLTILDEERIEQTDLITHSEGAINGAIAALLAPERIRDMVIVNPAGLIGKDTIPRLVGRNLQKNYWQNLMYALKNKDVAGPVVKGQIEGAKYIAGNPKQAYNEVRAISDSEIEEMLLELHNRGIGIAVMAGVDDPVFTMDPMQRIIRSEAVPGGFVDGFASVRGGHDDLHLFINYTGAALGLLNTLNEKPQSTWERLKGKKSTKIQPEVADSTPIIKIKEQRRIVEQREQKAKKRSRRIKEFIKS